MAPITDDIVSDLKASVKRLEARVVELESQFSGNAPSAGSGAQDTMRMVIMGPPGAGEFLWAVPILKIQ